MDIAAGEHDIVRSFAGVTQQMALIEDPVAARHALVMQAWDALGSAGAALWKLTPNATMSPVSCTDPSFIQLMIDIVGERPDGPAFQTLQDRTVTLADDFETETRWPDYTRRLLSESPVRSAVVYPLGLADHDLGVLAVYSHERHHFTAERVAYGSVFAACASLALENISLSVKAHHLEIALGSNRRIGMAIGILMARNQLTETQAFDLLRVASNQTNTKLADIAEEVVYTGTVRRLTPGRRASTRRTIAGPS